MKKPKNKVRNHNHFSCIVCIFVLRMNKNTADILNLLSKLRSGRFEFRESHFRLLLVSIYRSGTCVWYAIFCLHRTNNFLQSEMSGMPKWPPLIFPTDRYARKTVLHFSYRSIIQRFDVCDLLFSGRTLFEHRFFTNGKLCTFQTNVFCNFH